MNEFMRSSDAFTWSMESDPRLRSTVVTVMLLDRTPNWDEVPAARRGFEPSAADAASAGDGDASVRAPAVA